MGALSSIRPVTALRRRSIAQRLYRAAAACFGRDAHRAVGRASDSEFETLETRVLLSAVNYAVPDASDHALTLSIVQVNATPTLQLVDNGTVVASQSLSTVTSVSVTGGAGHDVLTVDLAGGNPLASAPLTFNGGGASNSLVLVNGSIGTETYTPTGASSGGIVIDGGNLTYANLGGITDLAPAATVNFFTSTANSQVNVVDGPLAGGVQTMEVNDGGGGTFLTTDLANKQHVMVDTNGGTDTVALDLTAAPAQLSTFFLNTDSGGDTVDVMATPAGVSTSVNAQNAGNFSNGPDEITVGNNGSVQQIMGPLSLADDLWFDDITIDDSADTIGRTFTYAQGSITGLAPAVISYNESDIFTITVNAGSGGNAITVADTVVSSTNTLNIGSGDNTVVVQSVLGGSTLQINGQGGHDSVTVDISVLTQGSEAGFQSNLGSVDVTNPGGSTALTIDAGSETNNQNLTIASSWESGLGSSPVDYNLGAGSTLDVKTGSGADSFQVNTTGVPTTLEGGAGANSYTVDLTGVAPGAALSISDAGGGQATLTGTSAAAVYTIGPAQTSVAGGVVNYSGLSQVTVQGYDGADTFNVTPSASTTLNVYAGAPSGVTLNNTLNLQPGGASDISLSETSTATGFQGAYTFGNRQPVNFQNIQAAQQQQSSAADLAVSLSGPAAAVEGTATYDVTISNLGPSDAPNSVLSYVIPAGTQVVSASVGQGTWFVSNGQLFMQLGTLANGQRVTGNFTLALSDEGTTMANVVSVSSGLSDPDSSNNTASLSTSVSEAALNVTGGFALSATEGATSSAATLALFTDLGGAESLSDYSATINWGDGSSSAGTLNYDANTGQFSVTGSHQYAEEGTYALAITVHHDSAADVTVNGSATVADPAISATGGLQLSSIEGSTAAGGLATFTDPGGAEALSDYSATINWGDGTSSAGSISYDASSGLFTVSGSHTYAEEGIYAPVVTIGHDSTPAVSVTDSMTVSDASVAATGASVSALRGINSGALTLATFTDPAGAEAAGDYSATINWGDGSSSAGTISFNAGTGLFSVGGSHLYGASGSYSATVTLHHDSAADVTVSSSATVTDPAVVMTGGFSLSAAEGAMSGSQVLATFTDPGGALAPSSYVATIDWGDGSTSVGAVSYDASTGLFSVAGGHLYAGEGAYAIGVTVHDGTSPNASATSNASISDPSVSAIGGFSISAEGLVNTGPQTLATFTDPGGPEGTSHYTASINWGDGSSSAAAVSFNPSTGLFTVLGGHTYTHAGKDVLTVTIHHDSSADVTVSDTAKVVADPPVMTNLAITPTINEGGVAHLTASIGEPVGGGTMTLLVNWGPGQGASTYTLMEGSSSFDVTHVYLDNPAAPATSFPVTATLSNVQGSAPTGTVSVVVKNLPPVAAPLAGPAAGVRGQMLSFSDAFSDAGVLDTHKASINWGDGTRSAGTISESNGSGTALACHVFTASGTYKISMTITDKDGGSATVTRTLTVSAMLVEADSVYGGTMLVIGGTTGADAITVRDKKGGDTLRVDINGSSTDVANTVGRIVVYGQGGGDVIQISRKISNPAFLYGGPGGNALIAGGGPSVLVGGTGNDTLIGGAGRTILIGGGGSDTLMGGSDDDVLISGSTAYDHNDAALAALFNEWTRPTLSYAARVADLMQGGGLNGKYVLNNSTLLNTSAGSILVGNTGMDWFIFNSKDHILDRSTGEIVTRI